MNNPYDKNTELKRWALYKAGYEAGQADWVSETGGQASRVWPQAYRYGYSDGYCCR